MNDNLDDDLITKKQWLEVKREISEHPDMSINKKRRVSSDEEDTAGQLGEARRHTTEDIVPEQHVNQGRSSSSHNPGEPIKANCDINTNNQRQSKWKKHESYKQHTTTIASLALDSSERTIVLNSNRSSAAKFNIRPVRLIRPIEKNVQPLNIQNSRYMECIQGSFVNTCKNRTNINTSNHIWYKNDHDDISWTRDYDFSCNNPIRETINDDIPDQALNDSLTELGHDSPCPECRTLTCRFDPIDATLRQAEKRYHTIIRLI